MDSIHLIDENQDITSTDKSEFNLSEDSSTNKDNTELTNDEIIKEDTESKKDKGKSIENYNETETNNSTKDSRRMTEFEQKVQRFMSMHMDDVLSDLKKDITNSTDSSKKEELEKAYYNEVDFKLEVDSLTSKLDQELTINDPSSSNNDTENKKRNLEEVIDSKNKKTK